MTKDQEERLVAAWEGVARALGDLNETARIAISKHWPDPRQPREAVVTRLPNAEDKIREKTGNTDGPITEWLGEFDPEEEELGPREKEFLARQAKQSSSTKASSQAGRQGAAGSKASRRRSTSSPIFP